MKVFAILWEFVEALVFAGAIFVVCYLFLFQPNQVSGKSMYPTFDDQEYILTDKLSYKMHQPKYEDVVVFKSPKNPDIDFIKRVIGLPGDTIKVSNGKVYRNGQMLDEAYLPTNLYTSPGYTFTENREIIVPEDSVVVFGDNRPGSSDSREFGPIKISEIIGRVFFRYFPITKFGPTTK